MIEEKIVSKLREKGLYISFAESMSAGLLASRIVNVSGSSNVLDRSFITYSNKSKMEILNVKKETIDEYDVVSKEVAKEMAEGLKEITKADVCVSITGYADGHYEGEDKGVFCYCILYKDKLILKEKIVNGTRNEVRYAACDIILEDIYDIIK